RSVGEIIARSDGVMQGYWQQPESTAEVMRGGWFHTGDMATWTEDGYLLVVDRKKDMILRAAKIFPPSRWKKLCWRIPRFWNWQ
ncbi:MAG TPA: AMP-binding protein, partial [Candidatus Acidoferrales bacterium]|nr:AMP-binding protein [Candidatus Acidoferrales bacterium]